VNVVVFIDSACTAAARCGLAAAVPTVPRQLQIIAGILFGLAMILVAASVVVYATTMLRRQIRDCRISARIEGMGARRHPNQNPVLAGTPAHPLLELIIGRLIAADRASQPPGSQDEERVDSTSSARRAAGLPTAPRRLPDSATRASGATDLHGERPDDSILVGPTVSAERQPERMAQRPQAGA
jgi:hypothetical protein